MPQGDRDLVMFEAHRDASSKFDHFLLGATLATCGYLAQTNPYGRVGYNIETMYLVSLIALALSAYFGFKRVESKIQMHLGNAKYLEMTGKIHPAIQGEFREILEKMSDRTAVWYRLRNGFLFSGFIAYILTKIFSSYLT
ncbi:hypothetical protein ACLHTP_07385 [Pseudomonas aeruginosa]|uniref:hypothetical protein n=1 Tax=Pseudomonas TaxID=286 RepID=UPI000A547F38|nr:MULTISPECIES: hypothetical protein [Pseudomonas]EIU7108242.1 hypothetical protein [Pseudomonas aeruginosa]EKU2276348.1 hypothetical protein [Pseudomonas aeruginosa]EKV3086553.1 hypothetical protein [Pseudomonas aeruginosa]EKV4187533.1 hypothetical protein [Pseudomonas aeruginosa]EKX2296062.1 hypothetical protein [Pseudomonas aeruginosa]